MKTTIIFAITILFASCDSIPDKNKGLAKKLYNDNSLNGIWAARPSYTSDSIMLVRVDTGYGNVPRVIRFNKNKRLDLFDMYEDQKVLTCGNSTDYTEESNWELDPEKGLLYLDLFGTANVIDNFHIKKSYLVEYLKPDTISLRLFKTITDETKR
jgi:hypothetical protein